MDDEKKEIYRQEICGRFNSILDEFTESMTSLRKCILSAEKSLQDVDIILEKYYEEKVIPVVPEKKYSKKMGSRKSGKKPDG